ncbi:hypothetical protein [Pseudomonas entomophila]|uniref:hypothetical protein n=1 Tax=Pseudomonas entomophila TaxID=312306 RepID=UPI003EBCAC84
MNKSVFEPLLCFNARCYWQFGTEPISARQLPDVLGKWVKPLWVEFNDWNGDDGWLMSGRDYDRKEIQSFLYDQLPVFGPRQRLYCEYFWFGVYRVGERYAYEIRPAYAGINVYRWPELQYVLDVSHGGYLGMYPTDMPAGSSPLGTAPAVDFVMPDPVPTVSLDLPTGPAVGNHGLLFRYRQGKVAPLWTLEGLEPSDLQAGDIRTGIELYGPAGRKVRRLLEQGRAYLNDKRGSRGRLAIQVIHVPVPPHPKPDLGGT